MGYTQGVTRRSRVTPRVSHTPQLPRSLCGFSKFFAFCALHESSLSTQSVKLIRHIIRLTMEFPIVNINNCINIVQGSTLTVNFGPVKKDLNWSSRTSKHSGTFLLTSFPSRMSPNVFEINYDNINKIKCCQ